MKTLRRCPGSALLFIALCLSIALRTLADEPPKFSDVKPSAGEIVLKFTAPATFNSRLEFSTDLVKWIPLATFPRSGAALEYSDSSAVYLPFRYYRVAQLNTTEALTGDHLMTADGDVVIHPINHATFVMSWKDKIIYIDPVGGSGRFQGLPKPTLVLVTDIHGDHLDSPTLNSIGATNADIVAPQAVFQQLSSGLRARTKVLANGETAGLQGLSIESIPMYNTTRDRLNYHTKGRGNGYVLTIGGKRLYISGDTEDVPEMRALKNIDVAFVCMNLPFTMTVDQAASAVREFRPAIVYPFHSSGSNLTKFKQLVGTDLGAEVRLRKWY